MAPNLLKRNPMFREDAITVDTVYQFGSLVHVGRVSKWFIVHAGVFRSGIHVNRTARRSLPQVGYVHANL